jgi:arylsulfatase A-like enzyme
VDFAPTLLSLCGIKPPAGMQGADLGDHVAGRESGGPDSAFFQIFGPYEGDGTEDGWRGVRTERYMYARFESKPWVLYDLQQDPTEMRNLLDDQRAPAILREMEHRLEGWMRRTGDSWKNDWHELVEDKGRLYTQDQVFYSVNEYLTWAKARLQ